MRVSTSLPTMSSTSTHSSHNSGTPVQPETLTRFRFFILHNKKVPRAGYFFKIQLREKVNILLVDPIYPSRCCRERRVSITIETNTFFDYL